MKVTVLGSGAWGTALALLLLENGNQVAMWSHHPAALHEIRTQGENPKLPGVPVPERLELAEDMSCAAESDVVVLATPSFAMRETAAKLNQVVRPGTILVSVGKGIEKNTSLRMSEVIQSEIQAECPLVVLCGPTHAEEVGRRIPSGIVAASQDREAAEQVQDLFMNSRFRVYTSSDVIGVEISAAMKNVIALCAGISDGVGYGDNTRAMLITRGLTEIARLGVAQGVREKGHAIFHHHGGQKPEKGRDDQDSQQGVFHKQHTARLCPLEGEEVNNGVPDAHVVSPPFWNGCRNRDWNSGE